MTAPLRFLILSRGRTGSTLLQQLLDSHHECVCFEEVFADRPLPPLPEDYPAGRADAVRDSAGLRETSPTRFMDEFLFADHYADDVRAVGFKLFYMHARSADGGALWDSLQSDTAIRIVHLQRRNILRMFISMKIANQTGAWWSLDGMPELNQRKVVVDPVEFEHYVAQLELARRQGNELFAKHPVFQIAYEEIEHYQSDDRRLQDLLEFLELAPQTLRTPMQRQNPERLEALISNYEELRARFEHTPLQTHFDDSSA